MFFAKFRHRLPVRTSGLYRKLRSGSVISATVREIVGAACSENSMLRSALGPPFSIHEELFMKIAVCVFLATALLLAASHESHQAQAAAEKSFPAAIEKSFDDAIARELKAYGGAQPSPGSVPGAVVGVWVPGRGTYVRAVGYSNLSPQQPMSLDDKFRIGSNTKTFVVTVLLQLVDEHKLGLDDPVSKFDIGVKIPNGDHITIRELCQMRSGLVDAYNAPQYDNLQLTPETKLTPRELIATAVSNPPLFPPGAKWNYSNTNYLMLGLVIEAVTHNALQDEIERRVIAPLKLTHTTFPTTNPNMPQPFTHGFALAKDKWDDVTVTLPPSVTWAAGVMISDMPDMKRWVKAYVSGSTNSPATQHERLDCISTGEYGLAFGLGIGCSGGWYGYTGGIPGYNTGAYYFPEKDATVIAFVNSQIEKPDPGVANSIVRDITQILYPDHVAFPTDPAKANSTK
jgi:D-alanyl-D-alanine carboxypeptidase